MAFARDSYIASASQTDFTITFPYLETSHVKVFVDGTELDQDSDADTGSFSIVSSTTARIGAGLTGGETVIVLRNTSRSARIVDYASASTLTEEDLDNDSLQAFYLVQEALDAATLALTVGTDDNWDATSTEIKEVGTPTTDDAAANKEYVDDQLAEVVLESGNLPASTEAEDGDYLTPVEGTPTWTDPEWAGAEIEDAAIDEEHFAEEAVATADIADAAVTAAKLDAEIAGVSPEGGSEGQVLTNEEGTTVTWGAAAGGKIVAAYEYLADGEFVKATQAANGEGVYVHLVAGGGGGCGVGGSQEHAPGGGGGAGIMKYVPLADISADAEIVIGEGGVGDLTGSHTAGGDSSFDGITCEGGQVQNKGASESTSDGADGGRVVWDVDFTSYQSFGAVGRGGDVDAHTGMYSGGSSRQNGSEETVDAGGCSTWGGAGGAGDCSGDNELASPGLSAYGGNGGAAGQDGEVPGGGGGGLYNTTEFGPGDGGDGWCRIYVVEFDAV